MLTETASDGIVSLDEDSQILLANSAACRIFGYTVEELVGSSLAILMPERFWPLHRAGVSRYLATGDRHMSWRGAELIGLHKDGHEIPLEVSFADYVHDERHIFTGIIRDITERKRFEDQLRHTAKLESVGVLAGGIAHDFNNLLTGILGYASLVLEMLPEEHAAKGMVREIIGASERAAGLTQQILAYAGKGRFMIEPLNLSKLVREITTFAVSTIPKTVHLRLDVQEDVPLINADAGQLQQVIMNLVINAAEAIREGENGLVTVTTGIQEVDSTCNRTKFVVPNELACGPYVLLEVSDSGIGMDQGTIDRIFDPFYTTKFAGRGLGLAAVLGIIRSHRGALKVDSTPGQGSTFKVLFPVETLPVPAPARCTREGLHK